MTARCTSSSSKRQEGGLEANGVDRKRREWEYNKARKGKVVFQRVILDMCFS